MSRIRTLLWLIVIYGCTLGGGNASALDEDSTALTPSVRLNTAESRDQDDMCVWVNPLKSDQSTIIASDKSANRIFVYDLEGQLLQTIPVTKPGNIDIRQKVTMGGREIDIVAVNQRSDGFKLVIFRVNPDSRQLERIDDNCVTGPNYGGCLYHSAKTGRLFFVCTSDSGTVEQYELNGNGQNGVNATKVRKIELGKCEGAVADDETGSLYISEETKGVWKFDAEPDAITAGTMIAAVGDRGLKGDVEGLALLKGTNDTGYLLVSDQGRHRYMAYQRKMPHHFVGEFAVEGAVQTDGIEVCNANLGPKFPAGVFACHTDTSPRPVLLTPWPLIEASLSRDLKLKSPNGVVESLHQK